MVSALMLASSGYHPGVKSTWVEQRGKTGSWAPVSLIPNLSASRWCGLGNLPALNPYGQQTLFFKSS